jgi:hypothetical protein
MSSNGFFARGAEPGLRVLAAAQQTAAIMVFGFRPQIESYRNDSTQFLQNT